MYFRKTQDLDGEYVDAEGIRYSIAAARRVRNQRGVNTDYVAFASLKEALAAWGFVRIFHD